MGVWACGFEGEGLGDVTECFWLTVVFPVGWCDILVDLYLGFFPVYHRGMDPGPENLRLAGRLCTSVENAYGKYPDRWM